MLTGMKDRFLPPFGQRLQQAVGRCKSPVLVGLDPRREHLPEAMLAECRSDRPSGLAVAYGRFCREVIDVVAPLVAAVKPQSACFEQLGHHGMRALAGVIRHARRRNLLVIFDGKRNDIGRTASAYAEGFLGARSAWGADALTINPYLGEDSLRPFVDVAVARQAGLFVLVKTSNPGGGQFQDALVEGRPLYAHVAQLVEMLAIETAGGQRWGAVGAVCGATFSVQLSELRSAMPHSWLLVPGYGAQGGTARDVAAAFNSDGFGALVNNSRGIIFAYAQPQFAHFGEGRWQQAVEAATRDMIDQLRAETPAGKL